MLRYFNKWHASEAVTRCPPRPVAFDFIKKETLVQVLFLRTPFLQNASGRLLLMPGILYEERF